MHLAALSLGVSTLENSIDASTLAISSIALDGDNVNLHVGAAADEPAVGTLYVSDGKVKATIRVWHTGSLEGAWDYKDHEIVFAIDEGKVSDTISFSLGELGLDPAKGFFKVEVR